MKVYKVTAPLPKRDIIQWCGTQAEVRTATTDLAKRYGLKKDQIKTQEEDIPWDKAGHLKWLNTNLNERVKRPDGDDA
jgi:hypothetical protein